MFIWSLCLKPPKTIDALAKAISEAHRRYTIEINRRERWTGHLWQGRFASFVMDEPYALQAARYVEMNPVVARMVKHPADYRWSSTAAHLAGKDDRLVKVRPLLDMVNDWQSYLDGEDCNIVFGDIVNYHSSTGWPLGGEAFLDKLAANNARPVRPLPRGRPKVQKEG